MKRLSDRMMINAISLSPGERDSELDTDELKIIVGFIRSSYSTVFANKENLSRIILRRTSTKMHNHNMLP
jgi:hypothetical protein